MAHTEPTKKSTAPVTEVTSWSVEIWPRNIGPRYDNTLHIEVQATSKQEAINKAITEHPGHAWGTVRELDSPMPDPVDPVERRPYIGSYHTIVDPHNLLDDEVAPADEPSDQKWADAALVEDGPEFKLTPAGEALYLGEEGPAPTELWADKWEPTKHEGEEITLAQIVAEAIGTGSMCWEDVKAAGIFDSERAAWVTGGAIDAIERLIYEKTGYTHNELEKSYPYVSDLGEHVIIGPECFSDKAGQNIMWKGQHFRATPDQPETLAALINQALSGKVSLEEVVTRAYNSGYEDHIADASKREYGPDERTSEIPGVTDWANETFSGESEGDVAMKECGIPTQSEEDKRRWTQRQADKAAVIDLILSYRNPAMLEERMRQIQVVMD